MQEAYSRKRKDQSSKDMLRTFTTMVHKYHKIYSDGAAQSSMGRKENTAGA